MILHTLIVADRYFDSVLLMGIARRLQALEGVADASAVMGTPANLTLLEETGLGDATSAGAGPTDIVISLRIAEGTPLPPLEARVAELLDELTRPAGGGTEQTESGEPLAPPLTLDEAHHRAPSASLAVISLPGGYVRREAERAMALGLHPFIFSDNVPLADEVALKARGRELGLLVMGPDCGTAILDGIAFGFANVVARGPVGIIGASGTGIQEVTSLLDRRGIGIRHAIGVGGRDLSLAVGGASMLQALEVLEEDPACRLILLLSKPPHPEVAERVLARAAACCKPCVVCLLGGDPEAARRHGLPFATRLDLAAALVEARLAGVTPTLLPDELSPQLQDEARALAALLLPERIWLRGLFSGGTLCEEALLVARDQLGSYRSNLEPAASPHGLGEDDRVPGHLFLDLGDDRYTRGRPHPMIDFTLRGARLREEALAPTTAVLLLDVVLGHGAHPDPAGALAELVVGLPTPEEGGPVRVASLTGTEHDPQPYSQQRQRLEDAGFLVCGCNTEAARFSAAIIQAHRTTGSAT